MNNGSKLNFHPLGGAVFLFLFLILGVALGTLTAIGALQALDISQESKLGMQILTLAGQISGFLLPALVFLKIFGRDSVGNFYFKTVRTSHVLMTAALGITAMGIVAFMGELNVMALEGQGGFIAELKKLEDQAAQTMEIMLSMNSLSALFINIFLVAVVPAICEELAFRGVLQSQLAKVFKNEHAAIWVTGILFSAIHFQFFGFLPRMLLGALFGYLLIYSGSILMPILAHFINNALGVTGYYIAQNTDLLTKEQVESTEVSLWIAALSGMLVFGIIFMMKKTSNWEIRKREYLTPSTS